MLAEVFGRFKRNSPVLIFTALILLVIQYYEIGRVTLLEVAVYPVALLLATMEFEMLNVWWRRRFGTSRGSAIAQAALWLVAAVCLYLFFRHMDRR